MVHSDFLKGPNALHPEQPSAVGSRNSLNRDHRDEYVESRLVVDEEVDKIINHVQSKLPPEVLQNLDVMGNIKSSLHNYFNQSFQNMSNRYLTTAEDELSKKVRDLIDKEEHRSLNRYTPREVAEMLNSIGGKDVFNTGEVEKSVINIMGHLQGHVQRGTYEYETSTVGLLEQRQDVGAFIRSDNTYAVVKCSFRDNYKKPDKVVDVKLAVNVLDSELVSPIIVHQLMTQHLIKQVIAGHIHELIEKEIDELNGQLRSEGRSPLDENEQVFEKIKSVEHYTDDGETETSLRYQFLSRNFLDRVEQMSGELTEEHVDALSIREMIDRLLRDEHLRTRGWNTAVNTLTSILDTGRMGYQYIQNHKNARLLVVREYEQTDQLQLPDEHYDFAMRHYTPQQIREEKLAYSAQLAEFQREVMRLWDVVEAVYVEEKQRRGRRDWNDVVESRIAVEKPKRSSFWGGGDDDADEDDTPLAQAWNEISFVQRELTSLEALNQTYEALIQEYKQRFLIVRRRLKGIFENNFPAHRLVVEERLNQLESEFLDFMSRINPYHIQPGLVLEVNITSIKRLKMTVFGMTNVLKEFLNNISKGFGYSTDLDRERHRSTVKEETHFERASAE